MFLFPKVGRAQPRLRLAWGLLVAFLCLGVVLHLFPVYFMLVTSFKPALEVFDSPPSLWPKEFTTSAWQLVGKIAGGEAAGLLEHPFSVYFRNSLVMTLGTLLLSLPVTSFAAYAVSKLQRGKTARWNFLFFTATLFVPFAVILIPSFLLSRNFPFALPQVPLIPGTDMAFPSVRIWDTLWAIILPAGFSAGNFLFFKGFFDTIPDSIIQAARVDGGSEFNIFRRIVLPMSVPVYAVAALGQFQATWDSYLWPSLVIQTSDQVPTSVAINLLSSKFNASGATDAAQAFGQSEAMRAIINAGLSWNGLMVLGILQTIPLFIVFIIAREYLLRGVKIRGFK